MRRGPEFECELRRVGDDQKRDQRPRGERERREPTRLRNHPQLHVRQQQNGKIEERENHVGTRSLFMRAAIARITIAGTTAAYVHARMNFASSNSAAKGISTSRDPRIRRRAKA